MKKEQKNAFDIKLEKETRKQLIKYIAPIAFLFYLVVFYLFAVIGAASKLGVIGWIVSNMPLSIVCIIFSIAMFPCMWIGYKPDCRKRAYKKLLKDMSKSLVEKVMTPEEPIGVVLTKSKGDFGDFVLRLQEREKIELYAVLGEKDNLIAVYVVLKGEDEKIELDVVTKEEFGDFYKFVDNS